MRLTLRTLLAYMDDILDPADHEQLSQKIETSDFATELIHRSRDTVRRLRLGAPDLLESQQVMEDSSWADPNVVSEYLDNTLAAEEVAEYERVCLESDLNLAEVASCHHILTMVLGEPAEVDQTVRQHLYGLAGRSDGSNQLRIEPAHHERVQQGGGESGEIEGHGEYGSSPPSEGALPGVAQAESRQVGDRSQATESGIPDYLKEASRSRRKTRRRFVAAAALAAVLGVVGYFASGVFIQPELPPDLAGDDSGPLIPDVEIGGLDDLAGEDLQTQAPKAELPQAGNADQAAQGQVHKQQPNSVASPFVSSASAPSVLAASEASGNPSGESQGLAGGTKSAEAKPGPMLVPAPVPARQDEQEAADLSADGLPQTVLAPMNQAAGVAKGVPSASDGGAAKHEKTAAGRGLDSSADTTLAAGEPVVSGERTVAELAHVSTPASSLENGSRTGSEPVPEGALGATAEPARIGKDVLTMKGASKGAESSAAAADTPVREPAKASPIQLGNYLGNNDVLLRFDPQQKAWVRMPPRSNLFTGERLLTLPKFRTQVVLAGINLSMSGGTQIAMPKDIASLGDLAGFASKLGVAAGQDNLALEIVYGRILINAGLNGSGVVLKAGDLVCWLQMGGSAGLAVEVSRQFVPGRDTETEPAPILATWYLTSGKLQFSVLDGASPGPAHTIQSPAMWSYAHGVMGAPQLIDELPAWIDREPVTQTERRALTVLDDELVPDKQVGIRLLELNDRRQREVRTLAAQCSLYIGNFEPFVKALNDAQQKAAWKTLINMLRQAMALSPDAAGQLREAFVMLHGEEAADDLMQMVRGYSKDSIGSAPEAVKNGPISKLIGWLDHDSLDYRVLASFNLREITGKSMGYRPEYSAKQRQRGIRTWRKRLESGELLPVSS